MFASTPLALFPVTFLSSSAQMEISLAVALMQRPPTSTEVITFRGPPPTVPWSPFKATKTCILLSQRRAYVPREEVQLPVAPKQSPHPPLYPRTRPNLVVTAPRRTVAPARLPTRPLTRPPTNLPFLVNVTYLKGPEVMTRVRIPRKFKLTNSVKTTSMARNSTDIPFFPATPHLPMH